MVVNKVAVLAIWFAVGCGMATYAAMHGQIFGIAQGAAMIGGCIGYLVGRIDLRKELGLTRS